MKRIKIKITCLKLATINSANPNNVLELAEKYNKWVNLKDS
jgi:hypothetical protein